MLKQFKRLSWVALLAVGLQPSFGFVTLGPVNEAYQDGSIGYNLAGDLGAPKNYGQEYRRNTPVMYYAFDESFLRYFGSNGVAAVDAAFEEFNRLPNVSSMSSDLSEFPLNSQRRNLQAEALFMIDLKSFTMQLLIEQLGLGEPERYTWTLHDRYLPPGGQCPPDMEYLVIKRNWDPLIGTANDTLKPSSYVNGVLYSYYILETCVPPNPIAITIPFPVDPLADSFTPVASAFGFGNSFTWSPYGLFYTGLTRDDVAGLRFLLRTNNVNYETPGPNTLTLVTNPVPQLLVSSNLNLLAAQALTNDAAALQTLYPNLVVTGSMPFFTNVYTTNLAAYFTNYPYEPAGTLPHLVYTTNITAQVATYYQHSFANLLSVSYTSKGWITVPLTNIPAVGKVWVTLETTSVAASNAPYGPVGSVLVTTNTSRVTYRTNGVPGDYFIMPTNMCEMSIVAGQLTNVVTTTNALLTATNLAAVDPNAGGNTNGFNTNVVAGTVYQYSQNLITYSTNRSFVVYPIQCTQTNVARRQGVERIMFVKRDYDSLSGQLVAPVTNEYVLNAVTVTNSILPQRVRRVVAAPDILFTAADLTAGPGGILTVPAARRNLNFSTNAVNNGSAGPGTLDSPTTFIFNNVGPVYFNGGLFATNTALQVPYSELDHIPALIWGSFDGTTNVPTIYPAEVSVENIENQMLIQINPQYLPEGTVGRAYDARLSTVGYTPNWQAPYIWSLPPPPAPGLPPGLAINSSGQIYGTPVQSGFFDFAIRVTDAQGRTADRSMFIKITP